MYNVLSENSVYHNVKAKIYPDGTKKIVLCNKPIFKDPGFEVLNRSDNMPDVKISKPKNMANSVRYDSIRRSKEKVFDIALINTFSYFVTWTLDSKKIDRYNPKEVSKKLRCFLNHKVQRNDLNYLIIPEYHKDGAIHMHGLVKGNLILNDSGKKTKDGKVIYNMPQWNLGFSTAIELTGNSLNVAKYITKYITKDFKKIFGSFYYAGGKSLKRSPMIQLYDMDYEKVNTKEYYIDFAKIGFKYPKTKEVKYDT